MILNPSLSTEVAHFFGVGRGADLILYILFILTLFLIVMAHRKMKKIENQLTRLARKISLNEIKRK